MPAYRIYLVGSKRQILADPVVSQLENDAEAFIRAARLSSRDAGAQVWREQRLVCQLPLKGARRPQGHPESPSPV
jgi:hypothetical protein